jgi:hypothetical protein
MGNILFDFRYCSNSLWYNYCICKKSKNNNILYYIGIIGNALLVLLFIFVRLFTPPFSAEGTPVNDLDPNGSITLLIEILIAVLLVYIIRFKEEIKTIK